MENFDKTYFSFKNIKISFFGAVFDTEKYGYKIFQKF